MDTGVYPETDLEPFENEEDATAFASRVSAELLIGKEGDPDFRQDDRRVDGQDETGPGVGMTRSD